MTYMHICIIHTYIPSFTPLKISAWEKREGTNLLASSQVHLTVLSSLILDVGQI